MSKAGYRRSLTYRKQLCLALRPGVLPVRICWVGGHWTPSPVSVRLETVTSQCIGKS